MYPRYLLWGPGISKVIAFFSHGSTAGKDFLEEMSVQGTSAKITFWKSPCLAKPRSVQGMVQASEKPATKNEHF